MTPRRQIDLNADLGEGFGPWRMGDDAALLGIVTSASVACGGHAGDPDTMVETLALARERGVSVGAHPGYADRAGFGRRVIPMTATGIERMVATQIGALMGAAALAGVRVAYVKAHGALANLAADDRMVADAIARAVAAVSRDLAVLAISGTAQEAAAGACGLAVYSEIFADRAYLPDGRLVPRGVPGAVIGGEAAVDRLLGFLDSGLMPVLAGPAIPLAAHSVCLHGDGPGAVALARQLRAALAGAGIAVAPFVAAG
ncbi:5-oxoprolinase subunit PxpA [Paracoccaceae bacterium Fryx2]|nr:5-oxoprolinase subunit PxpA [Paracoccaceae bacterium Fryx2]